MPTMEGERAEGSSGEVQTERGADRLDRLALGMLETLDPGELLSRLAQGARTLADAELRKARLYADVRALSLTDALTGLANRRHLELHLAREFAAAKRGRPVSVVPFDPDLGPRQVSLSSGVAAYDQSNESPESLILASDQDMYRSKSAGNG